ncbi:MAG TPA: NUDIX hydrolase [Bacteroidales bacterium]|jgi:8-oxo-dGTP diphosphatase|nr:NUDIX hydrolase [Bacteroidota bacterium]HJN05373.1 NUDIX hydrolase [Bacteroidales bacterium]|tara:strand:+ start:331 stop:759 length:429 start_codon:yes stop_codon:yes gene_type:complete
MTQYTYKYPRPALTVDMMVTRNVSSGIEILLIQRLNPPFQNQWALPGGFVDMEETLEHAASRELAEETGLTDIVLSQFKAFSTLGRDPRGHTISVIFTGLASKDSIVRAGDDAKNVSWFSVDKLPSLAFDHAEIIQEVLAST